MTPKLIFIILNGEKYFNYLKKTLEEVGKVIKKNYHYVETNINNMVTFLNKSIGKNGLKTFLEKDFFNINMDFDEIIFYPSIFPSNKAILLSLFGEDNYVIYWGVNIKEIIKNQHSDKKLREFFKYLSDQTKYDIVKTLVNKKMYGLELANLFSLTPGTISYHISQLTSIDILDLVKEENRIYYSLNKKKFSSYIDAIYSEFDIKKTDI